MIVACGQMQATTMEQAEAVWPVAARLAEEAARARAELLVLPETTYPAYWLESVDRYMRADILRTPVVLERFSKLAARHGLWLVVGFVEEAGSRLYNSAAVFDPRGALVGTARKNFLWDCDNRWFAPGDSIRAMDTPLGRIGVMICADCRAPEVAATLVADGATMMILPTAWVNASRVRRTYRNIHPEFLIRARAKEFGVPFVCASKSGCEGDVMEYVGQSQLVSAAGKVLAEAPVGGEMVVTAEVTPSTPRPLQIDEARRERLLEATPPFRAAAPGSACTLPVRIDAESVRAVLEAAGARLAVLSAAELGAFAPARCAALDGAQVLVVRGRYVEDVFARARAAENRVFVVVASASVHVVVDPDGTVLFRDTDPQGAIELELGQADVKQFTPQTDLWSQRHVESYRFPAAAPAACGR